MLCFCPCRLESLHDLLRYDHEATVDPMTEQRMKDFKQMNLRPLELQFKLLDHREGFLMELHSFDRSCRARNGLILDLLARALTEWELPDTHTQLLFEVQRSPWFSHLAAYLQGIREVTEATGDSLRAAMTLIKVMLHKLPSCVNEVHPILLELSHIINNKPCDDAHLKRNLLDEVCVVHEAHCVQEGRLQQREVDLSEQEDFLQPPERFLDISVLPTIGDIHSQAKPFLRVNKERGGYQDLAHYLDVQFRLMRHDLVAPLSEGIQEYRRRQSGLSTGKSENRARFYHKVHILGPVCSRQSIAWRVQFDVKPYRGLPWRASKRFLHGSLICLSKNNFQTVLFGTVADSHPKRLAKGILDIEFEDREALVEYDHTDEFVMVESPAFYQAYRHVLQSMKTIMDDGLAMSRYILDCQRAIDPPTYLKQDSVFDMSSLVDGDRPNLRAVPALNYERWPSAAELSFNESQLQALHAGLTQEFSLIQGPPGTGKTFVGIKIVEVLMANKSLWNTSACGQKRPILVVCYTNHALDQFLEGIQDIVGANIVRIGGGSQSDQLQSCMIRGVRDRLTREGVITASFRHQIGALFGEMREVDGYIETCTAIIQNLRTHLLRMSALEAIAGARHYEQFVNHEPLEEALIDWLDCGTLAAGNARAFRNEEDDDEDAEDGEAATVQTQADFINQLRKDESVSKRQEEHMKNVRAQAKENASKFLYPLQMKKEKGGWTVPRQQRRRRLQNLRYYLSEIQNAMTPEEADQVNDIWALPLEQRWKLYMYWVQLFARKIREKSKRLADVYHQCTVRFNEIHRQQDLEVMRQVDVVGMTTSGASRYHAVLQQLTPPICIIEEAAEVLEAHVIASLNTNLKHLVLIGDHKQLRPNPTVYELAKSYNLDLSLFERMVNNRINVVTLTTQHRMRPEISALVKPIYPQLQDHQSVMNYPHVMGVKHDLFFINHSIEESHNDELMSKSNNHEAAFISKLCKYLLQQGYKASQITVLTPYSGQIIMLSRHMRGKRFEGVRVCIVDSYQGEENDIILLSLVRSNQDNSIGFLAIENRICVSLSRAKVGMYVIGNFTLLQMADLWQRIMGIMAGKCGTALPLYCQNHPGIGGCEVTKAEDFTSCPDGGCRQDCGKTMPCGHICPLKCHPFDPAHQSIECRRPCERLCDFGHRCQRLCHQDCPNCRERVKKPILSCSSHPQHEAWVMCHQDTADMPCCSPCSHMLPCGHPCTEPCSQPHSTRCEASKTHVLVCGHEVHVPCFQEARVLACDQDCQAKLPCGHVCDGTCRGCLGGRLHQACVARCQRRLLCGHACQDQCASVCPPCRQPCATRCSHRQCDHPCGEACPPCEQPCDWRCPHFQCTKRCGEPCDRPRCSQPCPKLLRCGHACLGACGEPCPSLCGVCDPSLPVDMYICLQECGHDFPVAALDDILLAGLTHSEVLPPSCPQCDTTLSTTPRYTGLINTARRSAETAKRIAAENNTALENSARLNSFDQLHAVENLNQFWRELLLHIEQNVPLRAQQYADLETLHRFTAVLCVLLVRTQKLDVTGRQALVLRQVEDMQQWLLRQKGRFDVHHGARLEAECKRLMLLVQVRGWGIGVNLPGGTKPLPEPMLTYHQ